VKANEATNAQIDDLIAEVVPRGIVVSDMAVQQLRPLLDELLELRKENQRNIERRKHTQDWYARHYGKLEEWARTILPDPWANQFFNCIANGTHDYMKPGGYFRMDTAEGRIILDQTSRAENAESEVMELRAKLASSTTDARHYDRWEGSRP
jgi:hypothetical protein